MPNLSIFNWTVGIRSDSLASNIIIEAVLLASRVLLYYYKILPTETSSAVTVVALAAGVFLADAAFGVVFFTDCRFVAVGFWEDLVYTRFVAFVAAGVALGVGPVSVRLGRTAIPSPFCAHDTYDL